MVSMTKFSPRMFCGEQLVIATHNQGKVSEVTDLISPYVREVFSATELGLKEPLENGSSFVANAELKAVAATKGVGMPALADDSGLVVHSLGGEPGIYSARWAGPSKDFFIAMNMIEQRLRGAKDRNACFTCALCLAWPDGNLVTVEGHVHGKLVWPPRGNRGFGYDPIFVATGHEITFGEMAPKEKQKISHRSDAFKKLLTACFSPYS